MVTVGLVLSVLAFLEVPVDDDLLINIAREYSAVRF